MIFPRSTGQLVRHFSRSMIRHGDHGHPGGVPGSNMPINLDLGKYKLTLLFIAYFGIGLGAPWLVVRHQLVRK